MGSNAAALTTVHNIPREMVPRVASVFLAPKPEEAKQLLGTVDGRARPFYESDSIEQCSVVSMSSACQNVHAELIREIVEVLGFNLRALRVFPRVTPQQVRPQLASAFRPPPPLSSPLSSPFEFTSATCVG